MTTTGRPFSARSIGRRQVDHVRARLAAMVHASADAIIGETLDGIITDWNPAAERLYGYTAAEVIGRHRAILVPPHEAAAVEAMAERLRHGESIEGLETVQWTKDGRRVDVSLTVSPVRNELGEIVAASSVVRDITPRKATEAALAASEALLRDAFANAPIGMVLASPDLRVLRVNPALCAMLGYTEEELLASDFRRFTHPADVAPNQRLLERALAGEIATYQLEKRYIHRDGHIVWAQLNGSLVRDASGDPLYFVSQIQDITARKAATEDLAASEERFRVAFEDAPIGMAIVRPDFAVIRVNRRSCEILGYPEDEILGTTFLALTHPDDRDANADLVAHALAGERRTFEMEKRYLRKDGQIVWALLCASLIRNPDGSPRYFLSQIQDITERKNAEAEFAATHQRTREVLERITDGFYALDRDWRFTYLNAAAEHMLGQPRADLLGRNIWESFPPAVETPLYAAYHQAMADGTAASFELYDLPFDGWYEVYAYPSADGLSVFFRDVTERRHLTEEVHASEAKFRALVEQLPAAVYLLAVDSQQTTVYGSPYLMELTGFPLDLVLNTNRWLDVVHPEDRLRVVAEDRRSEEAGESFRLEYRFVRPDGSIVWVRDECVPVRDARGTIVAWQGLMVDISERVAADEAHARLAAVVESAEDAVVSSTIEGTITNWNRGAEKLYGYRAEEIIGQPFRRLLPDDLQDRTMEERRAAARAGMPMPPFETTRLRRDGTTFAASVSLSPIQDQHSRITGISSITRDISDRKQLEADLRAALEAAQAAVRTKSQFLAMMSHELRTPLQAVLGYADFLLTSPTSVLTAEQREDIGCIYQGAERMVALIGQLLDLSRLEAGRLDLAQDPLDVRQIIEQVRQDVAPQTTAKRLPLTIRVPARLPQLVGDAVRLRQILLNLVGNAVKFTEAGSVNVTVSQTAGGISVTVRDTGIGISPEALPFIFEEFRQVDGNLTRRYGGAGLGLAIARKLAEQMGGHITVGSELGVGSTFTLWLPIFPPAPKRVRKRARGVP